MVFSIEDFRCGFGAEIGMSKVEACLAAYAKSPSRPVVISRSRLRLSEFFGDALSTNRFDLHRSDLHRSDLHRSWIPILDLHCTVVVQLLVHLESLPQHMGLVAPAFLQTFVFSSLEIVH